MNTTKNATEGYHRILTDIINEGVEIKAGSTLSTGSGKVTKDLWNYSVQIENPSESVVNSISSPLFTAGAVSRFIWMMGANNRIKDIEYYWGAGVGAFSDDEIVMPGSNYGARMITPRPGLNQIESVIKRLTNDPNTRRAAISIYHPEDAVRDSKDIPCAFGIFYTIRDNKLRTTILMRSNNAKFLFPYNIFEFSLLSDVIANEVGVQLGPIHFQAVSMHLYEKDFDKAKQLISEDLSTSQTFSNPIPKNNNPLDNIKRLIKLEADLRHSAMGFTKDNIEEWIRNAKNELDEYWYQYYLILVHFISIKKLADNEMASFVYKELNDEWRKLVEEPKISEMTTTQTLFGAENNRVVQLQDNSLQKEIQEIDTFCQENQTYNGKVISLTEYLQIKKELLEGKVLAARSGKLIAQQSIANVLDKIRKS